MGFDEAAYNARVVYRDERGVEYDPVPLPTHEVTEAVAVEARRVHRSAPRKTVPLYTGNDGISALCAGAPAEGRGACRGHGRSSARPGAQLSRRSEPVRSLTAWFVLSVTSFLVLLGAIIAAGSLTRGRIET